VGSTKTLICEAAAQNHPKEGNFIATHPLQGTEFSGPFGYIRACFKGQILFVRWSEPLSNYRKKL
jgi:prephenate dehydrogenase